MSTSRRARERNAQSKGETYSRADEALWDDAYLLKLFNEQLGNSAAVSEVAREDEQHSASSSSISTASRSEARDSASTSSSADRSSASSSLRSRGQHMSNGAAGAAGSLTNLQLPDDIRALAQSFYNAGFEAGRFVGRAESSKKESRKRTR